MSNVWILVADGAKANVISYNTAHKSLDPVVCGELTHTNEPSRELVTTERGRVFHSAASGRSAMERPTDPHEHEKQVFASNMAQMLAKRSGQFDKLVLVAAPKTLGDLRHCLPGRVKAKVVREIDKDLAGKDNRQLEAHLRKLIDFRQFHSNIH